MRTVTTDNAAAATGPTRSTALTGWKFSAGTLLLSLCSVTAAFVLQQLVTGSFYETNDDFAHAMVLSGALSGTVPDHHLITPNVLLAQGLKHLYAWMPSVPWYFAFLLGIQWAGCTAFQCILLKRAGIAGGLIAFWAYFVCVQAHLLLSLQFTSTAIFAATVGCLIVLDACIAGTVTAGAAVVCALLISGAALLRGQSCLMGLFIALPCLSLMKVPLKNKLTGLAALLIAAGGCYGLQSLSCAMLERDELWYDLYAVRAPLFKLIDSGGIGNTPDSPPLQAAGWTVNDGLLLKNFMYCDNDLFSARKIHAAAAVAPVLRADIGSAYVFNEFVSIAADKTIWAMVILCLMALALPGRMDTFTRWRFFGLALTVSGVMMYLLISMKLPSRVYFPCFAFLCAIALLNLNRERCTSLAAMLSAPFSRANKSASMRALAAWSCLACCLIPIGKLQYETVLRAGKKLKQLQGQTMICLASLRRRGGIYITFGNAFPYEFIAPSSNLSTTLSGIHLVPTGGYNNSPWFEDYVRGLNLNGGVLRNLDRSDVYVISSEYFNPFYVKFADEHLGAKVHMVPVEKFAGINVNLFAVQRDSDLK